MSSEPSGKEKNEKYKQHQLMVIRKSLGQQTFVFSGRKCYVGSGSNSNISFPKLTALNGRHFVITIDNGMKTATITSFSDEIPVTLNGTQLKANTPTPIQSMATIECYMKKFIYQCMK
eukprot:TRINITY_DN672_c0_g2_i1.p1 TRINITY_DN672_c0_g2~~TRINITY_DN672_c0_g2_i1.p1  ORF type:complete len:118 (+),score=25.76 TRINITY_DN672_c0_g2_i1:62-415(+)